MSSIHTVLGATGPIGQELVPALAQALLPSTT